MLFVWARAFKMSVEYGFPMISPDWFKPGRIGPLLRGEKDKRYYLRDFTNAGYIAGVKKLCILAVSVKVEEGKIELSRALGWRPVVVCVRQGESFLPFLDLNQQIWRELLRIIHPAIRHAVLLPHEPFIGVHVRRGDFVRINQQIDINWYVRAVLRVRAVVGCLPVRVFTDAPESEVRPLLAIDGATLMPKAPAIQDLMLLSRGAVIIGTSLSTFSLWASFLHRAPTVWPPVSPGVWGYGLRTDNHLYTDWDANLRDEKGQPGNLDALVQAQAERTSGLK